MARFASHRDPATYIASRLTVSTSSALTKGKSEVPRLEAPRPNCLHHYDRRDVDGPPRVGRAQGVAPPTRHNVWSPHLGIQPLGPQSISLSRPRRSADCHTSVVGVSSPRHIRR